MRVLLRGPTPFRNLVAIIKPLLDGVTSALHSDVNPNQEAMARLAKKTGWRAEEILHRLRFPKAPVLGPRRLLDAYRDFVKWNPADDLCEACTVLYEPCKTSSCRVDVWSRKSLENLSDMGLPTPERIPPAPPTNFS
jgi:hypothetical protein